MDHQGKIPYSSASDVARLTIYAMGKAAFSFICSQTERKVSIASIGGRQEFIVKNTNKILNVDGIDGVKTGLTSKAGPCLVVTAAKQPIVSELADGNKQVTPRRLVVVVLGASDRFGAARSLLLRGWEKFEGWNRRGRQIRDRAELLSMSKE
jgi:D-alanyl-D-alanine carboxypeptidase (penicillin-binding protein 5/6)